MKHSRIPLRNLAVSALIGAAYAALTMLLAPISYGAVQLRVSEVLCILPYFIPGAAWGLWVGCAVANILTGNIFDIIFGSLATLLAGLITAALGKRRHSVGNCLLACFQPVFFNALIVGAVITGAYEGKNILEHPDLFGLNALWVGLGELIVLFVLGFPLMRWLPGQKFFNEELEKLRKGL